MSNSSAAPTSSLAGLNIHNDILDAPIPTSTDQKNALLNELKSRARVCISGRQLMVAEKLYTKAIQVMSTKDENEMEVEGDGNNESRDLAILHSNRSLVYFQMSKLNESFEDATKSTTLDPKYIKGFWRLGSALFALEKYEDAKNAFKKALVYEPTNKAMINEVEKCKTKIKEQKEITEKKKKEQQENTNADSSATNKEKDTPSPSSAAPSPKPNKSTTTKTNKGEKKKTEEEDTEFTSSDHIRGYKIVNGKKTSFFHNEQTEEVKRLIGDITPKMISPATVSSNSSSSDKNTSAWNKAGTWEEKDVSLWAQDQLKAMLLLAEYKMPDSSPLPNSIAKITSVKKINGHASVATVRGKRRYIYEYSIDINWEMSLPDGDFECDAVKGTMGFPDIDGTCDKGEYEMVSFTVDGKSNTPQSVKPIIERFVKNSGLKDEVIKRIDDWVDSFKDTYS